MSAYQAPLDAIGIAPNVTFDLDALTTARPGRPFPAPVDSQPVAEPGWGDAANALENMITQRAPIGAYVKSSPNSAPIYSHFDGEKFPGGLGPLKEVILDYWAMRKRSNELFHENLYARGLIRRLITNEINTGLTPEPFPEESILNVAANSLDSWSDTVATRFLLWGRNPKICDHYHQMTYGAIQRQARLEALIGGDVLVVLRQDQVTRLPTVQLVEGHKVRSPFKDKVNLKKGHKITHGVEYDRLNRVVAYWVTQDVRDVDYGLGGAAALTEFKRLPAFGEKSGKRLAWLVFGTDKRLDNVRGQPLLSLIFQSLQEITRYRDSVQRKAVINSFLALFIKKTANKISTLPIQGGAVRRDSVTVDDGGDTAPRELQMASQMPGLVWEELQEGEEPVLQGGQGTDLNFGPFEGAIMQGIAWANEIPAEILTLAFTNNYSASQAAINEFKIYLNLVWARFGEEFCNPIYQEWLISEALNGAIRAPGFLEAWRDRRKYDIYGAWVAVEWYGNVKPSTDMAKQAKASRDLIDMGLSSYGREARTLTGTNFRRNVRALTRELVMLMDAKKPLLELQTAENAPPSAANVLEFKTRALELVENMENLLDQAA